MKILKTSLEIAFCDPNNKYKIHKIAVEVEGLEWEALRSYFKDTSSKMIEVSTEIEKSSYKASTSISEEILEDTTDKVEKSKGVTDDLPF